VARCLINSAEATFLIYFSYVLRRGFTIINDLHILNLTVTALFGQVRKDHSRYDRAGTLSLRGLQPRLCIDISRDRETHGDGSTPSHLYSVSRHLLPELNGVSTGCSLSHYTPTKTKSNQWITSVLSCSSRILDKFWTKTLISSKPSPSTFFRFHHIIRRHEA
jgi:hypothetical protein